MKKDVFKKNKKKNKVILISSYFLFIIIFVLLMIFLGPNHWFLNLLLSFFSSIFVYGIINALLTRAFKNHLVKKTIEANNKDIKYYYLKGFSIKSVNEYQMLGFLGKRLHFKTEDLIVGKKGTISFSSADVSYIYHFQEKFLGRLYLIKNTSFKDSFFLIDKEANYPIKDQGQLINDYLLYGKEKSYDILDNQFFTDLKSFKEKHAGLISLSIINGNICFAINNQRNYFELYEIESENEVIEVFNEELRTVDELISLFRLK